MYLDLAVKFAIDNPINRLPRMAAVLVPRGQRQYVVGLNRLKTHPLQAKFKRRSGSIYLHAEIDAIVRALMLGCTMHDISGASLYVARVLKDGSPALAKPCEGCQRALVHFGIGDVQWTINE